MIPIKRNNLNSAIASLDVACKLIVKEGHNMATAVEGTRRRSKSVDNENYPNNLQEFKKGPFHLAKNSHSSIVPVIIFGAGRLNPPDHF